MRSTTQRCRKGVKPVLPSGRVLTSRRHVGRWVAIGLEIVIVVLIVPEDRLEAREGCGRDQRE